MMIKKIVITALFAASLPILSQAQGDVCLDYWSVGMSGCAGAKKKEEPKDDYKELLKMMMKAQAGEEKEEVAPEVEIVAPTPKKKNLEVRVQEFLDNYEKPPKEFVAFNLEPTMENALKWVQKYNEMIDRNKKLTKAWGQAQQVYNQHKRSGKLDELPQLDEPAMEVPDYGVAAPKADMAEIDRISEMLRQAGDPLMGKAEPSALPMQNNNPLAGSQVTANSGGVSLEIGQQRQHGNIAGSVERIGGAEPIRISYYFSAECPYCQKFEPNFQKLIREMGDELDVTCVDMTPSGQQIENIHGKVDCSWRPLMPGEMKSYGVKSTPTLLVSRGNGKPIERISGYVGYDRLKEYLTSGK